MLIKEAHLGSVSAAAEIAEKYVKAHGADRKKGGGSRGGSGVSDSRTTVGLGSSGSDRNMFCVYCKKVGHRRLNCCKWKADKKPSVKVIVTTTKLSSQAEPSIPELRGISAFKPYTPRFRVTVNGREVGSLRDTGDDSFVFGADLVLAHRLTEYKAYSDVSRGQF